MAEELDVNHHDLVYCFFCSEWFQRGDDWDAHCLLELRRPPSKRCGAVTSRHTMVLPAFCLFCRQSENRLPSERLQYWERDADAVRHILETHQLPTDCSECGVQSVSLEHLHDIHGYHASSGRFPHETTEPRAEPESFDPPTVPSSAAKVSTSEWWCGGGDVDVMSGPEVPGVPDWFYGTPMLWSPSHLPPGACNPVNLVIAGMAGPQGLTKPDLCLPPKLLHQSTCTVERGSKRTPLPSSPRTGKAKLKRDNSSHCSIPSVPSVPASP